MERDKGGEKRRNYGDGGRGRRIVVKAAKSSPSLQRRGEGRRRVLGAPQVNADGGVFGNDAFEREW